VAQEQEAKMLNPTPLIRLKHLLVVGAVVAGATASTAGAFIPQPEGNSVPRGVQLVSRPPDVQDAAAAVAATQQTTAAGLKADGMRLQGIAKVYAQLDAAKTQAAPDVVERYVATHQLGGLAVQSTSEATRPPDVTDTALAVRYAPTASVDSNGFDWNDWAIGIGSGLGLAFILGAALLMGRQLRRHPVQAA
jgi:hypothetical protein